MATADVSSARTPVARVRPGLAHRPSSGTPGSPHTPTLSRSFSSQYGFPGLEQRAEEGLVIYDFGARFLRVGLAGESSPRCIYRHGPEHHRRAGDHSSHPAIRAMQPDSDTSSNLHDWELWRLDVRDLDLSLLEDKVERAIRYVQTMYLMQDTRPRKAVFVVPACLPHPILESVLRVLFNGPYSTASVSLIGNPVLNAVAAGVRSALVIDIGWHETTVTAIYEYREADQRRTSKASRLLHQNVARLLDETLSGTQSSQKASHVTFAQVEEIVTRLIWCPPFVSSAAQETEVLATSASDDSVSLSPIVPASMPGKNLADAVDRTFFADDRVIRSDEHDRSLPVLAWKALLALPLDIRAVCISRIIITGGASQIPGLKSRLLEEIEQLVIERKWDPVLNYGSAKSNRVVQRQIATVDEIGDGTLTPKSASAVESKDAGTMQDAEGGAGKVPSAPRASLLTQETDDITQRLTREAARGREVPVKATVRGLDTLGAWAGASIMASLRVDAAVEIKRDDFMKHGLAALGNAI